MNEPTATPPSFRRLIDRRSLFRKAGGATLSAGAVAMMAGADHLIAARGAWAASAEQDVAILNVALGAELEAVAAYATVAEAGILSDAVAPTAVTFMGHHQEHADALAGTIGQLGGMPVEPLAQYDFQLDSINNEADALSFAADLEAGAVSAYLGAVPAFEDRNLAQVAASILGDEAMHLAVLRMVLGEDPVPNAFVS